MKFIKKVVPFFLAFLLIYSAFSANNEKNNSVDKIYGNTATLPVLKVLEVEPGTSYDLQTYNNSTQKINNVSYNLNITSMPMSQYISTIDQINGEYDMVYIGNNTYGGVHYSAVGPNATGGTTVNSSTTNAKITTNSGISINQNGDQETYSENDITYKRAGVSVPDPTSPSNPAVSQPTAQASGLVNFIQSGQLTLFDSTILSDQSTLKSTNLYKIFDVSTLKSKIIQTTSASNVINSIVSKYNSSIGKPTLTITSQPLQYKAKTDGTPDQTTVVQQTDLNYKNLKFTFSMNDSIGGTHPVKADLFLDMNSDGLFQPAEALAHVQPTMGGDGFSLNYSDLPEGFSGLLQWKLEVTDTVTGAKNFILGSVDYAGTPKVVRVLQIIPGNGTNFNLNKTDEFPYSSLSGVYNTSVKEVTANAFSTSFTNQTYTAKATDGTTVTTRLNGNYDMIILGFADSYGGLSDGSSDIVDINANNEIKNFIASGQSVMFTHDTISDAKNIFPSMVGTGNNGWGYYLKNNFRDVIGQSRYIDSNNPTHNNIDGSAIPHDAYPNAGYTNGVYSNGIQEIGYTYASLVGHNTTTLAKQINKGLINSFPYSLLNDPITVATTHDQWFQLNLEDENVVPWYTLSYGSSDSRALDARNYYYTYSKGNITFSGSGHSSPAAKNNTSSTGTVLNADELKLFANTIYKASRSANHAPNVTLNVTNGQNVSKNQDFDCSFVAEDVDGDTMPSWKFIITDQNNVAHDVTSSVLNTDNSVFNGPIQNNAPVNIRLSKSLLSSLNLNGNFQFKVSVNDSRGATGTDTKTLVYVTNPTIALTSGNTPGYLVGDTANITLSATASTTTAGTNGGITFGANPLNVSVSDTSAVQLISSGNGWNNISSVSYSNGVPNITAAQTNAINLRLLKPNDTGNTYTVNNTLTYKYSGNQYTTNCPITLSVKQGSINVSVLDISGRVLPSSTTATLNKPDGTTETKQVDVTTGIATFDEPSGHYTVTVNTPQGYRLSNSPNMSIDLSFNNPNPQINMQYAAVLDPPTINSLTTNWTNSDVTFSLTHSTSYINTIQKMQYEFDATDEASYKDYDENTSSNNSAVTAEGTHTIYARTKDKTDSNASTVNSATVKIDKTPPPTPSVVITGTSASINYPDDVSNATDGTCSGVVTKQYKINGGSNDTTGWNNYTVPISIANTDIVYARSIDAAGNPSAIGQNYSFQVASNSFIVPENPYTTDTTKANYYANFYVNISAGSVLAPDTVTASVSSVDPRIEISSDGTNFYPTITVANKSKVYVREIDGSNGVSMNNVSASLELSSQVCSSTPINLIVKNTVVH